MTDEKKVKPRKKAVKKEPIKAEVIRKEVVELEVYKSGKKAHPLIKHFEYENLSEAKQERAKLFYDLAVKLDQELPDSSVKVAGLRNLLEAKKLIVRASL